MQPLRPGGFQWHVATHTDPTDASMDVCLLRVFAYRSLQAYRVGLFSEI